MRTLLGLAALAAFVAWCLRQAPGGRMPMRGMAGDRGRPMPSGSHVHAGDPTVRH